VGKRRGFISDDRPVNKYVVQISSPGKLKYISKEIPPMSGLTDNQLRINQEARIKLHWVLTL